jgi:hypothetical protein
MEDATEGSTYMLPKHERCFLLLILLKLFA